MSNDAPFRPSLTARQREWLSHLEAWRERGGTLKAYAREHGLLLGAVAPTSSVPVLRVMLPSGVVFEISERADPARCRDLLAGVWQALR